MPAALALLTLGALLSLAGLLGFVANWRVAADRNDLDVARHTALAGVGCTALGVLILAGRDPLVLVTAGCAAVAMVSLLTLAPLRHLAPG